MAKTESLEALDSKILKSPFENGRLTGSESPHTNLFELNDVSLKTSSQSDAN